MPDQSQYGISTDTSYNGTIQGWMRKQPWGQGLEDVAGGLGKAALAMSPEMFIPHMLSQLAQNSNHPMAAQVMQNLMGITPGVSQAGFHGPATNPDFYSGDPISALQKDSISPANKLWTGQLDSLSPKVMFGDLENSGQKIPTMTRARMRTLQNHNINSKYVNGRLMAENNSVGSTGEPQTSHTDVTDMDHNTLWKWLGY